MFPPVNESPSQGHSSSKSSQIDWNSLIVLLIF